MADLYSATPPTESGWYWWKMLPDSEPEVVSLDVSSGLSGDIAQMYRFGWGMGDRFRLFGLWGHRIPQPVAQPVEFWAVVTPTAIKTLTDKQLALDVADVADAMMEYRPQVVRGTFIPEEIVNG